MNILITNWDLEDIFRHFDAELIDIKFLSSLDKLLHESKTENWYIENILILPLTKIRNDETKELLISEYIKLMQKHLSDGTKNQKKQKMNLNN